MHNLLEQNYLLMFEMVAQAADEFLAGAHNTSRDTYGKLTHLLNAAFSSPNGPAVDQPENQPEALRLLRIEQARLIKNPMVRLSTSRAFASCQCDCAGICHVALQSCLLSAQVHVSGFVQAGD